MKIIQPSVELLDPPSYEEVIHRIERAARECYQSKVCGGVRGERLVIHLMRRGHHAMIEHAPRLRAFLICDRGVSHELVRHRIAAYAQQSTRYCDSKNGIEVIQPLGLQPGLQDNALSAWLLAMQSSEDAYRALRDQGITPEIARSVLPTALATRLHACMNMRQWCNVLKSRTAPAAHPQMRQLMLPLLAECRRRYPAIFENCDCEVRA